MRTAHVEQQRQIAVTRAELVAAGRWRGAGDRLVAHGEWVRAAPSTYLTGRDDLVARVQAALEHAGQDAVLTGWVGCLALGLPDVPQGGAVPVLVPAKRRRVSTPHVRVLPTARPPAWWTGPDLEVRVAAPARCVVDAVRALSALSDVRALVLGAVGSAHVSTEDLQRELEGGARGGRALTQRALRDAAAGAASAPEAELADDLCDAARRGLLPSFLLNPELRLGGRLVGRPDGWLLGCGVGWEVDSWRHHSAEETFDATLARHDRFAGHGLTLLHVTPRRLRALGAGYVPVLADAVRARRRLGPEPAGLVVVPRGPVLPQPRPRSERGRRDGGAASAPGASDIAAHDRQRLRRAAPSVDLHLRAEASDDHLRGPRGTAGTGQSRARGRGAREGAWPVGDHAGGGARGSAGSVGLPVMTGRA